MQIFSLKERRLGNHEGNKYSQSLVNRLRAGRQVDMGSTPDRGRAFSLLPLWYQLRPLLSSLYRI
jgi:hypothetical protein